MGAHAAAVIGNHSKLVAEQSSSARPKASGYFVKQVQIESTKA